MKFAYLRVSSCSQDLASQQAELPNDIDRIYEEKVSGATANRPELQSLLMNVRDGDFIWVFSLDRLARSLRDMLNIVDTVISKGGIIFFKKENLTFSPKNDNFMNNLLLGILASFAEWERNNIRFRQSLGIIAAKKKGVYKGKQFKLKPEQADELKRIYTETRTPISELARQFHLSRASCYRYLKAPSRIGEES